MKLCFLVGVAVVVLVLATTLQGCSAGDLTRGKAGQLIDTHKTLRGEELKFYSDGCANEMWAVSGRPNRPLNDEGRKYFKTVFDVNGLIQVTAKSEAHVLDVTGITGGEKEKTVEFTWQFKDVPDVVKQCCRNLQWVTECSDTFRVRKGHASLTLYDDGWRVTDVHLDRPTRADPS